MAHESFESNLNYMKLKSLKLSKSQTRKAPGQSLAPGAFLAVVLSPFGVQNILRPRKIQAHIEVV